MLSGLAEALDAYRKALEPGTLDEQDALALDPLKLAQMPEQVTVLYNIARSWEALDEKSKARDLYKKLLEGQPMYLDAYLRLFRLDEEEEWLKKALEQEPNSAPARLMLGSLALNKREWSSAQREFDTCLKNEKGNMYALVSLGNVYLHSWKDDKALNRACDFYMRALRKQPNNMYATHGVACVLAEKGRFAEAKEVLDMINESKVESTDALVNLGHVHLQLSNPKAASKCYQKALKQIITSGPTATADHNSVSLHLSRCLLVSADFEGAIEVLQGVEQQNELTKFNLAVVMVCIL